MNLRGFNLIWPSQNCRIAGNHCDLGTKCAHKTSYSPSGLSWEAVATSRIHELFAGSDMLVEVVDQSGQQRHYIEPMRRHRLHYRFANVRDADSAIEFANKNGFLGRVMFITIGEQQRLLEPLDYWLYHSTKVRVLLELMSLLRQSERDCRNAVRQCISVAGFQFLGKLIDEPSNRWLVHPAVVENSINLCLEYVQQSLMQDRIGGRLEQILERSPFKYKVWANLLFLDLLNYELDRGVRPALTGGIGSAISQIPRDLLGAIYAHLAQDYMQNAVNLSKCPACNNWFQHRDPRKKTCCGRCRTKLSREKSRALTKGTN